MAADEIKARSGAGLAFASAPLEKPPGKPLQYVEMEPAPELRDVVLSYWGFTVHALPSPEFVHRVWPDGCALVALGFARGTNFIAAISGPTTVASAVPVNAGERYWGIRFRPESGAVSCGQDATAFRDQRMMARDVFGEAIEVLAGSLSSVDEPAQATRILDGWIAQYRAPAGSIDALVREAVQQIGRDDGAGSMRDLSSALNITPRQLQRRFRAATGMTPKEYANIRRARAALRRVALGESARALGGWARLAAETGYADQAHLTREYARLLALTPAVVSNRLSEIAHDRLID